MEINEKLIAELKAKHPGKELYLVTVEGKGCILRSPSRQDLSYASVVKDPIKLNEVLLNQLWVAGDEEMKTDDSLFMGVCAKMEEVLKIKEAEIKKL
jgi:hypothetical protein